MLVTTASTSAESGTTAYAGSDDTLTINGALSEKSGALATLETAVYPQLLTAAFTVTVRLLQLTAATLSTSVYRLCIEGSGASADIIITNGLTTLRSTPGQG